MYDETVYAMKPGERFRVRGDVSAFWIANALVLGLILFEAVILQHPFGTLLGPEYQDVAFAPAGGILLAASVGAMLRKYRDSKRTSDK